LCFIRLLFIVLFFCYRLSVIIDGPSRLVVTKAKGAYRATHLNRSELTRFGFWRTDQWWANRVNLYGWRVRERSHAGHWRL